MYCESRASICQHHICTLPIEGIYFHALFLEAQGSIHLQVMVAAAIYPSSLLLPANLRQSSLLLTNQQQGRTKDARRRRKGRELRKEWRREGEGEDAKTHFAGGGTGYSSETG